MPSATPYRSAAAAATLMLLATSCTVYAPMQPTISTVSRAGQAEVAGSVQVNGRTEASVVYSPLPHLLVSAAGTFRPKSGADSTFSTTRQGELGLGGYLPLGRGWQLTGLAGYGRAATRRAYIEEPLIWGKRTLEDYNMRYGKVFGQASLTYESGRGSLGVVYRISKVSFDQLDYASARYIQYPVPLRTMVRHEGLLFGRYGLDAANRLQLQSTLGLSMSATPQQQTGADNPGGYQANHVLLPVPLMSVGVVFHPTR